MARRKRSPNSIRWNHRGLTQTGPEAQVQCLICMNQIRSTGDLKPPIEQVDYFVDADGTLTIKNDICPRTVALSLLCGGSESQKTFRQRLGSDYDMFILNLEQILKKHHHTCPGELDSQVATAEQLIREHELRQKLLSHSRKRSHDLMRREEVVGSMEAVAMLVPKKDDEESRLPDNFLSLPPSREGTPVAQNSDGSNLPTTLSEIPGSLFDYDNNNNNNIKTVDHKDNEFKEDEDVDDNGDDSRVVSPSLNTTGMTVAEAAIANKQMANTKRGSKILPVSASTDGLVKYQCPICSLELSGDHELTVHIRSHNQSHLQVLPNTCTICGKTLSSQSSLDRHMLVHSGERPFKCSICDMSFTTNGNMHRHSRIHKKNGINVKIQGKRSIEIKTSEPENSLPLPSPSSTSSGNMAQFPSNFRDDLMKRKSHSARQPDQNVEFLHYMNNMKNLQKLNLLGMSNYMFPFNSAAAHSAFPMSPFMHEQMRRQYMQAFINPLNGESLAKRPCFPPLLIPPVREPSPDLRETTIHQCKECGAEFNNQFSLESHMESHIIVDEKLEAEAGAACKTCKTVAKSAESLLLHTMTHHKPQEDVALPDPKSNTPPPPKEPSDMETEDTSVQNVLEIEKDPSSFMNLGFADCTTKKFPLIAKAFCEDNPDLKGNKFPVFNCQHCDKEFPVEGAKDLHEASHVPEEYTRCPKCNCHFADSTRLQEHMLKHVSDLKFEESLENDAEDETNLEAMPQNYFLAQFGLITTEDNGTANIDRDQRSESERQFDSESMFNVSVNDPSESIISEDIDWRTTDNEDDAKSCTSESRILTIPLNNRKDESQLAEKDMISEGQSAEVLTDVMAMQSQRSPASSVGSDAFYKPMENSALLSVSGQREGVLPPMFPCKYCDAVLSSASDLKNHQMLHKDMSQFQCKVCPYTSTDKSTLLRHMRTHSGERPYKCKLCDYSFTTKANCERHLRQKHNLDKEDLKDKLIYLKFDVQQILQSTNKRHHSSSKAQGRAVCKSCGVDFFHLNGLQQHLQICSECRIIFACKSCKTTFPTNASFHKHMSQKHSNIPANKMNQYFSTIENTPTFQDMSLKASSPPPAHSKSITTTPKPPLEDVDKATVSSSKLLKSFLTAPDTPETLTFNPTLHMQQLPIKSDPDTPLDFTGKKNESSFDKLSTPKVYTKQENTEDKSSVFDDQPLDLSVSRPSTSPDPLKGQEHSPTKQITPGPQVNVKQESSGSTDQSHRSLSHSPRNDSDGNNNLMSPLMPIVSPAKSTILGLLPKSGIPMMLPSSHLPKHPAFPQFIPIMSSLGLSTEVPLLSPLSPNLRPTGSPAVDHKPMINLTPVSASSSTGKAVPSNSDSSDLKVTHQAVQPSVILNTLKVKDKKYEKGSSSGSESSCELTSVTKMLDATDAQNFQDYLTIPETEDKQDSMFDSEVSEEDSNMSMENMFSNSMPRQLCQLEEGVDQKENTQTSPAPGKDDGEKGVTLTIGMALLDSMAPDLKSKLLSDGKIDDKMALHDPSNMSEQDIAKLIEKVSRENDNCPIKKKRNSYADSPHKFSCPYCPRCFPWMSSLNRHLLTHTGQKPFRCSRCPVTFSTKSNRERHLIRKHNVNMLDPSSRATMDRPYKCQLCVFSSFSTQSNLIKHYKDRHDGAVPPLKALEAVYPDKDDGDGDEQNGLGKTCEEEEEEYALAQMQENELRDMLQSYDHDGDAINSSGHRDPHKKRNAIFNLALGEGKQDATWASAQLSSNGSSARNSPAPKNSSTTLPGIDETVLTDTVREFLDKSIQQSLEDSQRKALEEGSTFCITPAMERHLRRIPNNNFTANNNQMLPCTRCSEEFATKKLLLKHVKTHKHEMLYACHLCDLPFVTRVECLQHQATAHKAEWRDVQECNGISNLEVFATRLDKLVIKSSKKEKLELEIQEKAGTEELKETKPEDDVCKSGEEEQDGDMKKGSKKEEGEKEESQQEDDKIGEKELPVYSSSKKSCVSTNSNGQVRKVHCALCTQKFLFHRDLKDHMQSHTGTPGKGLSQTAQVNGNSSSSSSMDGDDLGEVDDFLKEGKDDNDDMLHNLLGVESSTIDEIFESKLSAASILGVGKSSKE